MASNDNSDEAMHEHDAKLKGHVLYDANGALLDVSTEAFKKYSYVIMFDNVKRPTTSEGGELPEKDSAVKDWRKIRDLRKDLVRKLKERHTGLSVDIKKSSDLLAKYVLISASEDRLMAEAERRHLVLQLKSEWGGGWEEFTLEYKDHFRSSKAQFFRHIHSNHLIDSIIQAEELEGGAGLNMTKMLRDGIVTKYFVLHNVAKKKELIDTWAKRPFSGQPLDSIRNYFGEEIALYFAWLGFYTKWLWVATVPGIVSFVLYGITHPGFGNSKDDSDQWSVWPVTAYSIFLTVWATYFMEYWKRMQFSLAWKWGMMEYEASEDARPDFNGQTRTGVYLDGEWVPLGDKEVRLLGVASQSDLPQTKYSSSKVRYAKMACWSPMTLVAVTAVLIGTAAILAFRLFMQVVAKEPFWGAVLGGAMNAIFIILTNGVWRKVAFALTDVENHRTQTEWDDAFLVKTFLFQFINSYSSFYYLAFFKRGFVFFSDNQLTDSCRTGIEVYNVVSFGCLDELSLQVASILLTNMFVGQTQEVILPWITTKVNLYFLAKRSEFDEQEEMERMKFPQWEKESKLAVYAGTFDEYNEMVIQFGYLTMFAASLPIAPLLAVLNNVIEIRTDALKLLTSHPRPHYKGAQDIGGWEGILEVLGVLAVITNTMLIGLSFESVREVAYGSDKRQLDAPDVRSQDFAIFGAIVVLEHFLLALKYVVAYMTPDRPGWVRKEFARQTYMRQALLKKLEAKKNPAVQQWVVKHEGEDDDDQHDAPGQDHRLDVAAAESDSE